jgi:ribulose-phosphate 3-epimerase
VTDLPLHVHVMITDPEGFAPRFADAGANRLSFHPEVVDDIGAVIEQIRALGMGPGLAVHPDVGLGSIKPFLGHIDVLLMMTVRPGFGGQRFLAEVVPSIAEARSLVDAAGGGVDIEVDGGVNLSTIERAVGAGADILVAGSAIFDGADAPAAARRLRTRMEELTEVPG